MKTIFVSTLAILVLFTLTARAIPNAVPMKGNGTGVIVGLSPGPTGIDIYATGSGEATHLGRYTRTEHLILNPFNGTIAGTIVFIAANGDELRCNLTGAFTGPNTLAGTYSFAGGTGRFEDASGEAAFQVEQVDQFNFTVSFNGTIEL